MNSDNISNEQRFKNAMIYGTSHPEIYKQPERRKMGGIWFIIRVTILLLLFAVFIVRYVLFTG